MSLNLAAVLAALEGAGATLQTPIAQEITTFLGGFVSGLPEIEKGGEVAIQAAVPFIKGLIGLANEGINSDDWMASVEAIKANSAAIAASPD